MDRTAMNPRTKHKRENRRRGGVLRRTGRAPRTPENGTASAPAPASAPTPAEDDLADERRLRASGGPKDRATYTCSCGYVFEADVSTSVTCPHCGGGQAW
jgi:rubrerythrin